MANVNVFYHGIIRRILDEGSRDVNRRTGSECAVLPGVTFQTDLMSEGFPLLALRRIPVKNFVAEQMWFLSGTNKIEWLSEHTKIWDSFAEADGTITSAYGKRWRDWFENSGHRVDQIAVVLGKLKKDPTTRHGVIAMWDPAYDLVHAQKNVPCPVMLTLNIVGGRLHMHLVVRSNDMVLGFPTDVAGFAFLQHILAQELGVPVGVYTHSISNAHIYANHYPAAEEMARRYAGFEYYFPMNVYLPDRAYMRACNLDEFFFDECVAGIEGEYEPEPAIKGLVIAL